MNASKINKLFNEMKYNLKEKVYEGVLEQAVEATGYSKAWISTQYRAGDKVIGRIVEVLCEKRRKQFERQVKKVLKSQPMSQPKPQPQLQAKPQLKLQVKPQAIQRKEGR